jgi:hypothetical protein
MKRKKVSIDAKFTVLHEAGYRCANPNCRTIITLDIHHVVQVSDSGSNEPDNLLPLCPNCHSLFHRGIIPLSSIRAWKMILLAINSTFDSQSIDILGIFEKTDGFIEMSGDGLIRCAPLISTGLANVERVQGVNVWMNQYRLFISEKGRQFLEYWKQGLQDEAITVISAPKSKNNTKV